MFSFHKPKIYRSSLGCCICKAKSSSSRFTDSQKYENEFEKCFRIQEKRSGEICNACVLLVKRWKKLSPENRQTKHWHHVVDARAGPGTKLAGNRRLTSSMHNHNAHSSPSASSSASFSSSCDETNEQQTSTTITTTKPQRQTGKSDVLPLSSHQANNQSTGVGSCGPYGSRARSSSFSNKARAIDTNVSTFTFGEPRRNYMTSEPYSYQSISSYNSLPFTKPQSALNSSAFESVIKRFRQRQQQEQLEAQRRHLNKQMRQQQRSARLNAANRNQKTESNVESSQQQKEQKVASGNNTTESGNNNKDQSIACSSSKRTKRSSESLSTLMIDGLRISSILDCSLWRKEKICCGVIFRGPYDEIAVFPKLMDPCPCRQSRHEMIISDEAFAQEAAGDKQLAEEDRMMEEQHSRATKSGSISSCDSATSGTGSTEQPSDDSSVSLMSKRAKLLAAKAAHQRTFSTAPLILRGKPGQRSAASKRHVAELDGGSSAYAPSIPVVVKTNDAQSPSSSSGTSSLPINIADEYEPADEDLLQVVGNEVEDDGDEGDVEDDTSGESSCDASSSGASAIEQKNLLQQVL